MKNSDNKFNLEKYLENISKKTFNFLKTREIINLNKNCIDIGIFKSIFYAKILLTNVYKLLENIFFDKSLSINQTIFHKLYKTISFLDYNINNVFDGINLYDEEFILFNLKNIMLNINELLSIVNNIEYFNYKKLNLIKSLKKYLFNIRNMCYDTILIFN